jgi:hypothetical protein
MMIPGCAALDHAGLWDQSIILGKTLRLPSKLEQWHMQSPMQTTSGNGILVRFASHAPLDLVRRAQQRLALLLQIGCTFLPLSCTPAGPRMCAVLSASNC